MVPLPLIPDTHLQGVLSFIHQPPSSLGKSPRRGNIGVRFLRLLLFDVVFSGGLIPLLVFNVGTGLRNEEISLQQLVVIPSGHRLIDVIFLALTLICLLPRAINLRLRLTVRRSDLV